MRVEAGVEAGGDDRGCTVWWAGIDAVEGKGRDGEIYGTRLAGLRLDRWLTALLPRRRRTSTSPVQFSPVRGPTDQLLCQHSLSSQQESPLHLPLGNRVTYHYVRNADTRRHCAIPSFCPRPFSALIAIANIVITVVKIVNKSTSLLRPLSTPSSSALVTCHCLSVSDPCAFPLVKIGSSRYGRPGGRCPIYRNIPSLLRAGKSWQGQARKIVGYRGDASGQLEWVRGLRACGCVRETRCWIPLVLSSGRQGQHKAILEQRRGVPRGLPRM